MTERGAGLLLVIAGVLVAAVFLAGVYFIYSANSKNPAVQKSVSKSVTNSPAETPSFRFRQFDTESIFFGDKNYPSELVSKADSDLVGMSCSIPYKAKAHGDTPELFSYWDYNSNQEIKPNNSSVIKLLKELNDSTNTISAFQYCLGENGSYLIVFHTWAYDAEADSGWERGSNPNFLLIKNSNQRSQVVLKNSDDFFDESCWMPLQLTKTDTAYFQCGKYGKSPYQESYIYKVNFNTKSPSLVTYCNQEPIDAGFSFDPNNYKYDSTKFLIECDKK